MSSDTTCIVLVDGRKQPAEFWVSIIQNSEDLTDALSEEAGAEMLEYFFRRAVQKSTLEEAMLEASRQSEKHYQDFGLPVEYGISVYRVPGGTPAFEEDRLTRLVRRFNQLIQRAWQLEDGGGRSSDGTVELQIGYPKGKIQGDLEYQLKVFGAASVTFGKHELIGPAYSMSGMLDLFENRLDSEERAIDEMRSEEERRREHGNCEYPHARND